MGSLFAIFYKNAPQNTSRLMLFVVIAAIPGIFTQCYFLGWGTFIQIFLALITAWSSEALVLYWRGRPILSTLRDHSATVTALLLAISIPAYSPWWLIVIGTLFAILIAKHIYGGLGQNLFNPAMIGYVVLLISFPVQMTNWLSSYSVQSVSDWKHTPQIIFFPSTFSPIDGITQATPLDSFKTGTRIAKEMNTSSEETQHKLENLKSGWVKINLAYLLGGIFLMVTRVIRWQIPAAFLLSLTFFAAGGTFFSPSDLLPAGWHLFSGATMLGAFFIATDPVTASTTPKGRWVFGAIIGFFVWLIRSFGGYPDAIAFAVLLANLCVPLIDHYTPPRVYGHQKK